jgi:CBS domain containing-hemolysin-like protein
MEIFIILFLILLNGVFSMSEIAMVSSRKSRLEAAAKKGDKSAQKALDLANNPGKFLSTVQIGITLIGILTGIYSGEKIQDDLVPRSRLRKIRDGRHHRQQHKIIRTGARPCHFELLRHLEKRDKE